ncbi:alpha/beta hydrolase [Kitasatospora sp. McL0602]|uniref:alpha/beta hydrolase n=1 Tax=Kitasatospora sp. McL0602 TaxID=3439530 RepID=UPI003F88B05B
MIRPDESRTPTDEPGLRRALAHGAADLVVSPAPYAAIVRDGHGLRRRRAAVRNGLIAAMVVVPALTLALLPGRHPASAPGPAADRLDQPKAAATQQWHGVEHPGVPKDVKETQLRGRLSGVDGEVLVWTPPQYDDPAYKDRTFPVVELLAGFPASSSAWFANLDVSEQLAPLMKSGRIAPFILVAPRVTLLSEHQDTGCADVPGKVNAETWLWRDVPQMVLDNFRVDPAADHWGVAGYSAGAHCATRLAIAHPDRFRAAIAMSGYNDPMAEVSSLTAEDPHLREVDNPLHMLTHAQTPPDVALYLTGRKGDGLEDAQALARAAEPPTTVDPVETTGPHVSSAWKPMVPTAFTWLSQYVKP